MVTGDMLIIVNIGLYYLLTLLYTLANVVIFQSFKKNHCSYI